MKKSLFLLAILPLILLGACGEDDKSIINLSGTVWEYSYGDNYKSTLSFSGNSFEMKHASDLDEDGVFEMWITDKGTYKINENNIYFDSNDIDIKSARIDGNIIYMEIDESVVEWKKLL